MFLHYMDFSKYLIVPRGFKLWQISLLKRKKTTAPMNKLIWLTSIFFGVLTTAHHESGKSARKPEEEGMPKWQRGRGGGG